MSTAGKTGNPSEMAALRRGDIVLIPFPFTDLSSTKVRPGIVVSADSASDDVVVAFISSVVPPEEGAAEFVLKEADDGFAATGLKKTSVFKMGKLVTLERSVVLRRLGRARDDLQESLDRKLAIALGLPFPDP